VSLIHVLNRRSGGEEVVLATDIGRMPWTPWSLAPAVGVAQTLLSRATSWLGRTGCGVTGHAMVRHFEPGRISLQCLHCGEQTTGWTLHAPRA
jgi:hypothetical protein